jgi:hypothetical protein
LVSKSLYPRASHRYYKTHSLLSLILYCLNEKKGVDTYTLRAMSILYFFSKKKKIIKEKLGQLDIIMPNFFKFHNINYLSFKDLRKDDFLPFKKGFSYLKFVHGYFHLLTLHISSSSSNPLM